jgi:RNA polymerase sigma-70 factor (ECF subfamily)
VQVAARDAGPERELLSREIKAAQEAAMRRLTPVEKTAFVLRHLEDRSMSEIAAVLGIAPNAAKQAVFRAVQKLRRELAPLRGTA